MASKRRNMFYKNKNQEATEIALLSDTLRTYQRAACDDQTVTLNCPQGTSISVQLAQYGNSAPAAASLCHGDPPSVKSANNASCIWPASMQTKWGAVPEGSWGRTVVEACQKKRACKFHTSPKSFGGDPCPGVRKYVEVAYKCRPYEFRSKVACENDVVQLKCNPNSRIAIYSSSYGRTEYESVQCPQPQGVPEETCLVSYATETVMQICHGKRRCSLSADSATFGNPCRKESRMYLKVVYTCVPRKVLREQYEDRPEEDEMVEPEMDFDQYDSLDDAFRDSDAFSPSPNLAGGGRHNASARPHLPSTAVPTPYSNPNNETLHGGKLKMTNPQRPVQKPRVFPNEIQRDSETDAGPTINCTITIYTNGKTRVIGFISEWINAYNFLSQNTERLYLYLMLSVGGGLLSLMSLVIARLLWQRHMLRRRTKYEASAQGATALPNGFTDDISEVDADIDLTTVASPVMATGIIHQVPGEVVRYGGSEASAPRSLSRSGNSQYYYG